MIGDPEADWTAGLSASVTVKGVNVSAFLDHRQGGNTLNMTRASLYQYGTHGDTDHRGETHLYNRTSPRFPSLVASGKALHPLLIERTARVDL